MTEPAPINIDEALEVMDGDKALLLECFADFVEDVPEMLERIKQAMEEGNGEALQIASHKLKGSLRYLAATRAADIAYNLEMMGEKGGMDRAAAVFERLVSECERVNAFIQAYQQTSE